MLDSRKDENRTKRHGCRRLWIWLRSWPARIAGSQGQAAWIPLATWLPLAFRISVFDIFVSGGDVCATAVPERQSGDAERERRGLLRPAAGGRAGVLRSGSGRDHFASGFTDALRAAGRKRRAARKPQRQLFRYRAVDAAGRHAESGAAGGASAGAADRVSKVCRLDRGPGSAYLRGESFSPRALDLCASRHDSGAARLCYRSGRRVTHPRLGPGELPDQRAG